MPSFFPTSPSAGTGASTPVGSITTPCNSGSRWPSSPPKKSETISKNDYIKMWEKENCRKMTSAEKDVLDHGCIGITAFNLGINKNPPLDNAYATLKQAKARAAKMKKKCASSGKVPRIFSKRFYSNGGSYTPDPTTGKIDMSKYTYKAKPGHVNFDYGYYDETSNSWWHANHSEPGMKVYIDLQKIKSKNME